MITSIPFTPTFLKILIFSFFHIDILVTLKLLSFYSNNVHTSYIKGKKNKPFQKLLKIQNNEGVKISVSAGPDV